VVLSDLTGGDRTTTGTQAPYRLFTDPELARVGLSEREARGRGVGYRLAKVPMAAVFRAPTLKSRTPAQWGRTAQGREGSVAAGHQARSDPPSTRSRLKAALMSAR
jgi:hypothetical protein